jgi:U3 small nucleolar RNA-associated protein 13
MDKKQSKEKAASMSNQKVLLLKQKLKQMKERKEALVVKAKEGKVSKKGSEVALSAKGKGFEAVSEPKKDGERRKQGPTSSSGVKRGDRERETKEKRGRAGKRRVELGDEIDGEELEASSDGEDGGMEEEPIAAKKRNHLLKHFKVTQNVYSFFSGGTIHFCQDKKLVYSQKENVVVRFNLETKLIEFEISHNEEEIANFAISPKDSHIATFTNNSMLRYIKIQEKKIIHSQKLVGFFAADMVFDKSGGILVVGDPRGVVTLFELKHFKIIQQFKPHSGGLLGLRLLSVKDIFNIYTFGKDRGILVYDIKQGDAIVRFEKDSVSFNSIAIEEEGNYLVASGFDQNIHLWDIPQQKYLGKMGSDVLITCLEVLTITLKKENEKKIVVFGGTEKGFLKIWIVNPQKPGESKSFSFLQKNKLEIRNIIVVRELKRVVIINQEKDMYVLDLLGFSETEGVNLRINEEVMGYNDLILDVKFIKTPDNPATDDLLVIASNSETLRLYDYRTKRNKFIEGHTDMVMSLDTWKDYVLSGAKDLQIKLWKVAPCPSGNGHSLDLKCTFRGHQAYIISLCFSPKGNFFLSGSEDKTVKKWILIDEIFKATTPKVMKQAKRTVVGHDKQVNVVRVSPNGKLVASASHDRKIVIYDAKEMEVKFSFKGHKRGIWDIAFSPFEKILASCAGDKLIKIWSLDDASCLHTLEGHVTTVLKINWATLGSQMVSASADGLIKIWNYKRGICVNSFEGHEGRVWAMDFYEKEDKVYICTGDNNNRLVLWEDCTEEEKAKDVEAKQSRMLQLHQIDMLLEEGNYEEAIKRSFDMGLQRGLIKSLEKLMSHSMFVSDSIYGVLEEEDALIDPAQIAEKQRVAEQTLLNCVQYFLETDATRFLMFVRDINTKNKYTQISSRLLNSLLTLQRLEEITALHDKVRNSGAKEALENIVAIVNVYSSRHFERMKEHYKRCLFLQYLLNKFGFLN